HVDHLAAHGELLEIARGPAGALGNRLVGPEHADGDREGLRPQVGLQLAVRRLHVDHEWSPQSRRLRGGLRLVKRARPLPLQWGAMARVRIVQWRDLPSLVEAQEGGETVRVPLSQRFQDLIDAVAMREGASDSDAYLDGWASGPEAERPGAARPGAGRGGAGGVGRESGARHQDRVARRPAPPPPGPGPGGGRGAPPRGSPRR